jgi:hypothetical protein
MSCRVRINSGIFSHIAASTSLTCQFNKLLAYTHIDNSPSLTFPSSSTSQSPSPTQPLKMDPGTTFVKFLRKKQADTLRQPKIDKTPPSNRPRRSRRNLGENMLFYMVIFCVFFAVLLLLSILYRKLN